jgi:hypothetical protein
MQSVVSACDLLAVAMQSVRGMLTASHYLAHAGVPLFLLIMPFTLVLFELERWVVRQATAHLADLAVVEGAEGAEAGPDEGRHSNPAEIASMVAKGKSAGVLIAEAAAGAVVTGRSAWHVDQPCLVTAGAKMYVGKAGEGATDGIMQDGLIRGAGGAAAVSASLGAGYSAGGGAAGTQAGAGSVNGGVDGDGAVLEAVTQPAAPGGSGPLLHLQSSQLCGLAAMEAALKLGSARGSPATWQPPAPPSNPMAPGVGPGGWYLPASHGGQVRHGTLAPQARPLPVSTPPLHSAMTTPTPGCPTQTAEAVAAQQQGQGQVEAEQLRVAACNKAGGASADCTAPWEPGAAPVGQFGLMGTQPATIGHSCPMNTLDGGYSHCGTLRHRRIAACGAWVSCQPGPATRRGCAHACSRMSRNLSELARLLARPDAGPVPVTAALSGHERHAPHEYLTLDEVSGCACHSAICTLCLRRVAAALIVCAQIARP